MSQKRLTSQHATAVYGHVLEEARPAKVMCQGLQAWLRYLNIGLDPKLLVMLISITTWTCILQGLDLLIVAWFHSLMRDELVTPWLKIGTTCHMAIIAVQAGSSCHHSLETAKFLPG